jgi:hypothetical protein
MKTLKIVVTGLLLSFASIANAQVTVSVNVGSPPMWGPSGYTEVRYYYLPAVEAYYDINSSMFIYYTGGAWVYRESLPSRYRNYDLYNGYKVVMVDYHGNTPYNDFQVYKRKYAKGYNGGHQQSIGQHPGKGNGNQGSGRGHKNGKGKKH